MIRRRALSLGCLAILALAIGPLRADEPNSLLPSESAMPPSGILAPEAGSNTSLQTPEAAALRAFLSNLGIGESDEERNERAALVSFYGARGHVPLWLTPTGGFTPKTRLLMAEIMRADEWGLDARDFPLPPTSEHQGAPARLQDTTASTAPTPEAIAAAEIGLSQAVLRYARFARGGRIIHPAGQLSSYLDRRPQLLKPMSILEGIASAERPDAYLRSLHPQHPQFERLRQKYLALAVLSNAQRRSARAGQPLGGSGDAKRLLANMEQWRWMPADMGDLYIWNNVPEFLQRVVKNGEVVRTERIVAGEVSKQTPIFSRPMRTITFKPTWKVPDSIKVHELWPSLLRGGGLMREWALEVYTKEGQLLDWRKIDWVKTDIREYDVIQLNGPKSVLGKVKFSFPNQHTVFMHDTMPRDRYMFNSAQRTFSHGCMRVGNPMGLAELLLREDKGWDSARVAEVFNTGPHNNEIALDRKIPVHTTYFTAWVSDDGKLHTVPDVYGHERRIVQALDGKWDQIVKGRDHLAPVEFNVAAASQHMFPKEQTGEMPERQPRNKRKGSGGSLLGAMFGAF
jgi:murein L,D-transpeptidase YcbB/YkuD